MSFPIRLRLPLLALLAGGALSACTEVRIAGEPDGEGPVPDPGPGPDPDAPARVPATFCPTTAFSGGADDAVAVVMNGSEAALLMRDGATRALEVPLDPLPSSDTYPFATAAAGGGVIVVTAGWATFDSTTKSSYRTRWFSRSGELLDDLSSATQQSPIGVGPDGTSVLFRYDPQTLAASYLVRHPDGTKSTMTGFDVTGSPLGEGWLPGMNSENGALGFRNALSGAEISLSDPAPLGYPLQDANGFHYVSTQAGPPQLVNDSPLGTSQVPITGVSPSDNAYLVDLAASRYALIETSNALGEVHRYRVDASRALTLDADVATPDGAQALSDNCGFVKRRLGSDGRVLGALRVGGDARVGAVDPETGEWSYIGQPLASPGSFDFMEKSGTFVIVGADAVSSFCPVLDWSEAPSDAALPFDTFQIVRPESGSSHVIDLSDGHWLDVWSVNLSGDGTCAWLPTEDGGARVLDVVGDEELELPATSIIWLD